MSLGDLVAAVVKAMEEGEVNEDLRTELARAALRSLDQLLEEMAKRVGGDTVPDTVIARTAIEVLLAALAYARSKGVSRPIRLLLPSEPVPGWNPLRTVAEELAARRLIHVYPYQPRPRLRQHVKTIAARLARTVKGFSARTVDVTDAPPYAVAALYSAGVRTLTVLVASEHIAVFQKLSYTLPA